MPRIEKSESKSLVEREKLVRMEFGKSFDPVSARKRKAIIEAFWANHDLNDKICLDVGSGHPVIPAILTATHPSVRFDCVDISPDFEKEAQGCIKALGGDADRLRLMTADFYDIGLLASKSILEKRYDYILFAESLHHSLRKETLLKILVELMDEHSMMILMEPVLPIIGRRKAYLASESARQAGYIEEPITMAQYLAAFHSAGLKTTYIDYDTSRENLPISWKRRMLPKWAYNLYRRRIRPLYALTNFIFTCRLDT